MLPDDIRRALTENVRAFPSYPNSRLVSAVSEVVLALLGRELVEMPTDGLPESLLGAGGGLSEQLFQLCEELLDGVQIRRVGWQIQQARALLRCFRRLGVSQDAVEHSVE